MKHILEKDWGTLAGGNKVKMYSLTNSTGIHLCKTDLGAIITSIVIPVQDKMNDVILKFNTPEDYIKSSTSPVFPFFEPSLGNMREE